MSQTTVNAGGAAIGVPGQIYDSGPHDIVGGFAGASGIQVPFGYGLMDGSAENLYILATGMSLAYSVQGINVWGANHVPAVTLANGQVIGDLGASGLNYRSSLQVGRKGRFLVPVEAAVTVGQRAWCRGVATGAASQGSWRAADLGSVPLGGAIVTGASYFIDCTKQGIFRTASYTAADGTTLVAVLECDFTTF